nr:MAG TPA: hypothetical protein [Caudoviricetes sp.]
MKAIAAPILRSEGSAETYQRMIVAYVEGAVLA